MSFKDSLPKTEKELDIYFKLQELYEAKKRADMPLSMHGTTNMRDIAINRYNYLKEEYLKLFS